MHKYLQFPHNNLLKSTTAILLDFALSTVGEAVRLSQKPWVMLDFNQISTLPTMPLQQKGQMN